MSRRDIILTAVDDLVGSFVYYDRKEDKDLPRGAIEEAVLAGEITVDEIVEAFVEPLQQRIARRKKELT